MLKCKEALDRHVLCAPGESRLADLDSEIKACDATHLAVIEDHRLRGILSLREAALAKPQRILLDLIASELPPTIDQDAPLAEAADQLSRTGIDVMAVVDAQGQFLGALTQRSVLQVLLDEARSEVLEQRDRRQHAEEDLRQITEHIQDGVRLLDVESGRIIYCSPAYETLFGRSLERLYADAEDWIQAVHPEDRDRVVAAYGAMMQGAPFSQEYRIEHADGTIRWIHTRGYPVRDRHGRVYRIASITKDITARRRAELERAALAKALTKAEQRERRRLAQLLHDHLQQLLIAARMQLGALNNGDPKDPLQAALIRIDEILNESVDATRSLTVELSPPVLYEQGLCPSLHWLARWMQEKHALTVALEADDEAEPQGNAAKVLLFETVRELLFNVTKHARCEQALVRLARDGDGFLEILVADDGVGFDPGNLQQKSNVVGGFGLSNVRHRLQSIDGDVHVDTAPGRGTRVRLRAPIQQVSEETVMGADLAETIPSEVSDRRLTQSGRPLRKTRPTRTGRRSQEMIRVLVADDHRMFREGLVLLLSQQPDIEVVGEAEDGETACELAHQLQPDVVIMDINMPGMNGLEATQQITEELPDVCVIALSLFETDRMAASLRATGATAYLEKTGPSEQLVEAIRASQKQSAAARHPAH